MLTPNTGKHSQNIWERDSTQQKNNMKGFILVYSRWIRKQQRSRGSSCVKTSGCITTMPRWSRKLALNYISTHSSRAVLWVAILGSRVWTRRMSADCWQGAVAYNLSLPIGRLLVSGGGRARGLQGGSGGSHTAGIKRDSVVLAGSSCR